MLLFRKTALLGAAMMTPVMVNILMINLFFHIAVGAVCAAAFILVSMMALLWRERGALLGLFWRQQNAEPAVSRMFHRSIAVLVVIIVVGQTLFGTLHSRR
jgi:hypothetical protein